MKHLYLACRKPRKCSRHTFSCGITHGIAFAPPGPALCSGGRGGSYRKSKLPEQPIVFYGYEGSPFVKVCAG